MKLCTKDGSVTCSCSAKFSSIVDLCQKSQIIGQTVFEDVDIVFMTCPTCQSTGSLETTVVVDALMKKGFVA